MDSKNIIFSKTFWANAITLIIGFITVVSGQTWIPPEWAAYLTAGVLPILNIILRIFSDTQVTVLPRRM